MAFGEILLSAFLQVALDRLVPREIKEFTSRVEVDADLAKLKRTMVTIQGVLHDAEQKQITNSAVREWLQQLTHLAYDIDDLLDELVTDARRLKLEEESQHLTNQVPDLLSSLRRFWFKSKQSGKMKALTERLDEVATRRHDFGLSQGFAGSSASISQRRPTSSLVLDSHVYGRDQDVEQILELLLSDGDSTGSDNVSVIPIVGMGGVGKTTLAQLLYNHDEVDKHFSLKAWACISDAKFDLIRITKEILWSATKESFMLEGLQQLQERLKEILNEKKFLLVLDDVWSEDYNDWDCLRAPFKGGPRGSKIIVTTRSENVSSMMRTIPTYHLKELSEEDCQSLFNQHAFQSISPDAHPELKSIGERIVKKCDGLPLAAKTLGGLLRCKLDMGEWECILNSEIWDLPEDKSGILPSLKLSYHYLPARLKQCFSYCAIFPQDYVFEKKQLILLWMAEGFLQPKRHRRMEDTGDEYFRELLSRSIFQRYGDDESRFVMHDLIHDLAQSVSRGICFHFRGGLDGNNSSEIEMSVIRHTFVPLRRSEVISSFEVFQEAKNLRSLVLMGIPYDYYIPNRVPHYLLSRIPCLRVLCLNGCRSCFTLPESIGNLLHLRYLDLSRTDIKRLPGPVGKLCNLQTLLLNNCKRLRELLSDMSNLTELRHLHIDGCYPLKRMPLGMNKLTNLQTLPLFIVGKNRGPSIEGLKHMKQLRENLRIVGLENVVNVYSSVLGNQEHLDELELNWGNSRYPWPDYGRGDFEFSDEGIETAVIEDLRPHTNLKRLTVKWYCGTRFPNWLGHSSYSKLVNVELVDCRRCQLLPPLGCLPSLKNILIEGIWNVKKVGIEFYGGVLHASRPPFQSLEILIFRDMKIWEEWFGIEEGNGQVFPCLRELEISNCPKLRKFSHQFVKLEKLKIMHCPELIELPRCLPALGKLEVAECDAMVLGSIVDSPPPPLSFLSISKISNLKNLLIPLGEGRPLLSCLNALKELQIEACDELVKLSSMNEVRRIPQRLASLQTLKISHCTRLLYLSDDEDVLPLKSLTHLKIISCPHLHFLKLPSSLETIVIRSCNRLNIRTMHYTSLRELTIKGWPGLLSSEQKIELPSTLRKLQIYSCKNLKTFPELVMRSNNNSFFHMLTICVCESLMSFTRTDSSSSSWFPLLPKRLDISYCPNLLSLPEKIMYSNSFLEYLHIEGCDMLTSFPSGSCLGSNDQRTATSGLPTIITNVKSIHIRNCLSLNSLPYAMYKLTSLQSLTIDGCPNVFSFPDGGLPTASLQHLAIRHCPNLDPFLKGGFPSNLESLEILNCVKQKPISEWGLHNLTFLRKLKIGGFSGLVFFPECLVPSNLISLSIENLPDLQSLPDGLHRLTSLKELKITKCEKLVSLPEKGLPSSLAQLHVTNCPLLEQRCEEEKGEDWPKIADIPI